MKEPDITLDCLRHRSNLCIHRSMWTHYILFFLEIPLRCTKTLKLNWHAIRIRQILYIVYRDKKWPMYWYSMFYLSLMCNPFTFCSLLYRYSYLAWPNASVPDCHVYLPPHSKVRHSSSHAGLSVGTLCLIQRPRAVLPAACLKCCLSNG